MSRRWGGFTLIELLVAVAIMLIFLGSVFGVYNATYHAISLSRDNAEVYQSARVLLEQINREISCAYQSSTATTSTMVATNAGTTAVNLTFITSSHPAQVGQPAGDFCQVTYGLGDGPRWHCKAARRRR